jgi:hypothetical protein
LGCWLDAAGEIMGAFSLGGAVDPGTFAAVVASGAGFVLSVLAGGVSG